jgi:hypothetical protein
MLDLITVDYVAQDKPSFNLGWWMHGVIGIPAILRRPGRLVLRRSDRMGRSPLRTRLRLVGADMMHSLGVWA